jgi:hypothetical protein
MFAFSFSARLTEGGTPCKAYLGPIPGKDHQEHDRGTLSFFAGTFCSSHCSKIGATGSGNRRISVSAHLAPVALAAANTDGIS